MSWKVTLDNTDHFVLRNIFTFDCRQVSEASLKRRWHLIQTSREDIYDITEDTSEKHYNRSTHEKNDPFLTFFIFLKHIYGLLVNNSLLHIPQGKK